MTVPFMANWLWGWSALTPGATLSRLFPPVFDAAGNVTIIRGDSYYLSDGRSLPWSITGLPLTFDFTGSVTTFKAKNVSSILTRDDALNGGVTAGYSTDGSTGTLTLAVELSSEDTTRLNVATYNLDVQTLFANGHVETWIRKTLTVLADVR